MKLRKSRVLRITIPTQKPRNKPLNDALLALSSRRMKNPKDYDRASEKRKITSLLADDDNSN